MPRRLVFSCALVLALGLGVGGCSSEGRSYPSGTLGTPAPSAAGTSCTVLPADASDVARAYVAATDTATAGWLQVDANVRATGEVHRDDLPIQMSADAIFVAGLRAIEWPADAAPTAQQLIAIVEQYDAMLAAGYEQQGYLAEHRDDVASLDEQRARTSHALREILNLPQSSCTFLRP